jgi:catechol 2,3-dioxygenase-like lactoylglutathione lyase family enzyme
VKDSAAGFSPLVGLHHVRIPVSDVDRSSDWYTWVFGFEARLLLEEEDRLVGIVVCHPSGLTLGLHRAPDLARALRGFCPLAFSIGTADELTQWCSHLDSLGVKHSAPTEGHLGWYVEVPDPDDVIIGLNTFGNIGQPTADEA